MSNYHPEPYWSDVAKRIEERGGQNVIAGDDEPYYRYKRQEFLRLLHSVDFSGKSVLEIGHGPGGNLREVWKQQPARLTGVDISADMVELARKNTPEAVELIKIDGTTLPFEDQTFDIVFTATVLQHNTDEAMLKKILAEICRVSKDKVVLFERVEPEILGDELCLGRPVDYYAAICAEHGFELKKTSFINVRVSYYMAGTIRKLLNPGKRVEGEPLNAPSLFLQRLLLPLTRTLDKIFTSKRDVTKMAFIRKNKG